MFPKLSSRTAALACLVAVPLTMTGLAFQSTGANWRMGNNGNNVVVVSGNVGIYAPGGWVGSAQPDGCGDATSGVRQDPACSYVAYSTFTARTQGQNFKARYELNPGTLSAGESVTLEQETPAGSGNYSPVVPCQVGTAATTCTGPTLTSAADGSAVDTKFRVKFVHVMSAPTSSEPASPIAMPTTTQVTFAQVRS